MPKSDFDRSHPVLSMLKTSISGTKMGHECRNCHNAPSRCHCDSPDFVLVAFAKTPKHPLHVPDNFKEIIAGEAK